MPWQNLAPEDAGLVVGSALVAADQAVNWRNNENLVGWIGVATLVLAFLIRAWRALAAEWREQRARDDEARKPTLRKQLADSRADLVRARAEAEVLRKENDRLYQRWKEAAGLDSKTAR